MDLSTTANVEDLARTRGLRGHLADNPGLLHGAVSWGAIVAGAAAAAALSLILLILGVGLGLSSVSPWASDGVGATTFGVTTILWLTLTQSLALAMGGYLAGRLRTKWTGVHTDEVYFRDTAHGFLAWAGASMAGGIANTAGSAMGGAAASSRMAQGGDGGPIFMNVSRSEPVPPEDVRHVGQILGIPIPIIVLIALFVH